MTSKTDVGPLNLYMNVILLLYIRMFRIDPSEITVWPITFPIVIVRRYQPIDCCYSVRHEHHNIVLVIEYTVDVVVVKVYD